MTKREQRFVTAMEHCVENGEYTADYAVTILEDNRRYGWMSEEAKNAFYEWLDAWEADHQPEPAEEPEPEPEPDPANEPAGNIDEEDDPDPEEETEPVEEPEPEPSPNTDPEDDPEPGEDPEPAEEEGE